ncbi:MAG: hypothetical protein H0X30_03835 [Anaerolineae bacterium]|nr:hypothetical protein [Anaerolineae bacterium]
MKRLSQYQLLENDIVFGRKGAVDRRALISKKLSRFTLTKAGVGFQPSR